MSTTAVAVAAGTHEDFVRAVREVAVQRAITRGKVSPEDAERLLHAKLVYGLGNGSYRGVCHYKAWSNGVGTVDVVEIAATAEESWIQLAGTTIHETAHVLGQWEAGHGAAWKEACDRLGLRNAKAAGMVYTLAALEPVIREQVAAIAVEIADGSPSFGASWLGLGVTTRTIRPCSAGIGTRGGKSRGPGSGSRMLKVTCGECGNTARQSARWIAAGGVVCGIDIEHGRMVEA